MIRYNTHKIHRLWLVGTGVCVLVASCWALVQTNGSFRRLWITADQEGQRSMQRGDFSAAAKSFQDPMRRGVALYRDGQFEEALKVFNSVASPESLFNRGNCEVMLGRYPAAIEVYDKALKLRPEWQDAQQNRALALRRKKMLAPPEDDAGGTGGMLGADEIVFDDRAKNSSNTQEVDGDEVASDNEMRAVWLRKVQTRPADFLRVKFAYQLQFGESPTDEEVQP